MTAASRRVDISADMGESLGRWPMGGDEEIAPYLTSAHIACGFHASDPATIRKTVELLHRHRVALGAHPGYQDLIGFGRHKMDLTPQEVDDLVLYQVAAVRGMVEAFGGRLQHVKPHGALYNVAEVDEGCAGAIAAAVKRIDPHLAVVATPAFEVSMEMGAETALAMARTTGTTRASSVSSFTGSCPGRVESPPTSIISAPAATKARAWATAASTSSRSPSPEKLSGVTLTMPMM